MLWILAIIILAAAMLKVPVNPKYDSVTTDRLVEFNVFGFADKILIDDNPEFYSPMTKEKPFIIDLEPGVYYWKAEKSILTGKFTIQSEVGIQLEKLEDKYRVNNTGNVEVDLGIEKKGILTGAAVLGFGNSLDLNLENNSVIIASQRG